jgi:hypothetical protein
MTALSPQSLAVAALVGLLAGTHAAIWGMYKDAIHEGFALGRFSRSVLVGAACAVIVQAALALPLPGAGALVVLFGLAYAAERGLVEVWKTFVREEDQSKYFIPMQFSLRGVPVAGRGARLAAGAAYVAIRYGLRNVFRHLTVHRGMFHSIPAMLLAGLAVYHLHFDPHPGARHFLAGGVMVGFLSHLVLDEVCSVDLRGARVNKAFGSALKLWGSSPGPTLAIYALAIYLGWQVLRSWPGGPELLEGLIARPPAPPPLQRGG